MAVSVNVSPLAVVVGLAVIGAAWVVTTKGAALLSAAGEALEPINPYSADNLVNRGVSAVGAAVTGDDSWSLGGQLAEWFDPATREVNRIYGGRTGGATGSW